VDWRRLGQAGVASGWRRRVADRIEGPAASSRLPIGGQEARALAGIAFVAVSVAYLVQVGIRLARG
jgi:hypothetical protein